MHTKLRRFSPPQAVLPVVLPPHSRLTLSLLTAAFVVLCLSRLPSVGGMAYYIFFIVVGICSMMHIKQAICVKQTVPVGWLMMFAVGVAAVFGLAVGNFRSYWMLDVCSLSLVTLASCVAHRAHVAGWVRALATMVAWWMAVAIPLVVIVAIQSGFQPGSIDARFDVVGVDQPEDAAASVNGIANLLVPALFVAPFASRILGKKRLLVPLAIALYLLFGVFSASRGAVLSSLFALAGMLLAKDDRGRRPLVWPTLSFGVCGLIFVVMVYGPSRLAESMFYLQYRVTSEGDVSSGRLDEIQEVSESLGGIRKVVGYGLGASKENLGAKKTEHGVAMVHIGYMHLLMKGGFGLLLAIYGVALFGVYRAWKIPFIGKGVAYMILAFLLLDMMHTQWQSPMSVMFLCVAISCVFAQARTPAV